MANPITKAISIIALAIWAVTIVVLAIWAK